MTLFVPLMLRTMAQLWFMSKNEASEESIVHQSEERGIDQSSANASAIPTQPFHLRATRLKLGIVKLNRKYSLTNVVNQISQPANVKEALAQPRWLKAMQDDL